MYRTFVSALTALALAPLTLADPINLAPKFEVGRSTKYRYASETSQKFIVSGREQGAGSSSSDTRATLTVDSVDDQNAVITVVFDSAVIEGKTAQLDVVFDSSLPPERDPPTPLSVAIRSFIGQPVKCIVSLDGALIRVEPGFDYLPKDDRARRLALQYLSEPNLRWLIDTVYLAKTDPSTTNVGENWTRTRTESHPLGSLRTIQTYTVNTDNAGLADITIKGTDEVQKLVGVGAGQGAENVEHLPGEITGTLRWDSNRGQADRFEITTKSEDVERHPQAGEIRKIVVQNIIVERLG
ncbi:MAG: hypothetical protein AB7G17_03595 [Phycisphaerales bacterium]